MFLHRAQAVIEHKLVERNIKPARKQRQLLKRGRIAVAFPFLHRLHGYAADVGKVRLRHFVRSAQLVYFLSEGHDPASLLFFKYITAGKRGATKRSLKKNGAKLCARNPPEIISTHYSVSPHFRQFTRLGKFLVPHEGQITCCSLANRMQSVPEIFSSTSICLFLYFSILRLQPTIKPNTPPQNNAIKPASVSAA